MAAPAVLGLAAFVAVPFIVAIVLSFYDAQLNQVRTPKFFGFTQYVRLFTDPVVAGPFFRSLLNNLVFAIVVIPVQTAIALGLAILLNSKLKGIPVFRTIFFMPVVFPMALVAVIWRLILDRSGNGLLNAFTGFVTAGHFVPQDWLGSAGTALGAVILLSIWQGAGFQMVIILAGLQEIPTERFEAASLDRANAWQQFIHITLPGLRNTLIFVTLYTTIMAFQLYDQVYILIKTAGGNQTALQTVLYQGTSSLFDENNLGRAAAVTVVFFAIVLVIALVQRSLLKQRTEE
ncbi:sugar ABC transporter permease [Arthrobacter sp. GN70]|uniref:Sugar ABC transporter permease n=2 Tax=Arthrobacter TaxID=1663 RepID=A0A4R5K7W3_9MICC|nr:sugar ABC transporter permease [Arthrobacter sp. GN70]TDF91203.1 sugar ABC transporter permease [Arthrobacter terricola]